MNKKKKSLTEEKNLMYDSNSSKFWPLPANMLFHAAYLVYLISFSSMFNRIYVSITYEKKCHVKYWRKNHSSQFILKNSKALNLNLEDVWRYCTSFNSTMHCVGWNRKKYEKKIVKTSKNTEILFFFKWRKWKNVTKFSNKSLYHYTSGGFFYL